MENEEYVPEGAIVVRNGKLNKTNDIGTTNSNGYIFKTIKESHNGRACYGLNWSIPQGDWRYATALELYCFKKYRITNIGQITDYHKQYFKKLLNNKEHGNIEENELQGIETTRPSTIGQRAVGIRKPTKQVTNGSRLIGNETKGKYLKQRVTSVTLKTDPIKF